MPKINNNIILVPNIKIVKEMRDYSNDPFCIMKKENAISRLKKLPFITEQIRKIREQKSTDQLR